MNRLQASIRLAGICVTLGVPFANANQTVAVTSPLATQLLSDATPAAAATEETKRLEGRLFFSEQERRRMDDARKRGFTSGNDGLRLEAPQSVLNGFVKRSDGNTVVWVDGNVRWNAKTSSTSGLLPTDVGGPSEYLKSTSVEAVTLPPKPARAKKIVKPRVKKSSKPRQLP